MVRSTIIKPLTYNDFRVHFLGKEKQILLDIVHSQETKVCIKDFQIIKVIGVGGFSKVYLAKKLSSNELFAIKSIKCPSSKSGEERKLFLQQVQEEKTILMQLKHPFIVKLKYAFYEERRFFLVMPFIQGGEILSYIQSEKKNKEKM